MCPPQQKLRHVGIDTITRHTGGVCTHDKYDTPLIRYNDNLF